jgi:hypothetical protein
VLLAASATADNDDGGRVTEAEYLVTFLGLPVYTARLQGTVNASRYKLEFRADPQGIARLGSNTRLVWETRGAVAPSGFEPRSFDQRNSWRKQTRRIELNFAPDSDPLVRVTPPESPGKRPPVPEALRRGTVDPLTAVLAAVSERTRAEPCAFRAQVFEGLRRTDVHFSPDGRDTQADIEVPGARGDVFVCEMHLKRVAGYEAKALRLHPDPLPAAKLWIVHLPEAGLWLPVQLRFQSRFGPVYARLTRVTHRAD